MESQLISWLRTGNPLLDAILTTIILCSITSLSAYGSDLLAKIKHLMKTYTEKQARITAQRYDTVPRGLYDAMFVANEDYEALLFFITHLPCPKYGTMKSLLTSCGSAKKTEIFLPNYQHSVYTYFENTKLELFIESEIKVGDRESKNLKISNDIICICGSRGAEVSLLHRFLVHVRDNFKQHQEKQAWQQKIYHFSKSCWFGCPTHSNKTFDTVVLDIHDKETLIADFKNFLRSEEWYRTMGLSYRRGYMFHGPPGTGKTSMILALATESKQNIYCLDLSKLVSDVDLDTAFQNLPSKCLVVLEDVDAMGSVTHNRSKGSIDHDREDKEDRDGKEIKCKSPPLTLSTLLNHLDGVGSNHGRIFVMTTNHPEVLDPALVRPGRIDLKIHLDLCSRDQLRQFYRLYYKNDTYLHMMDELPEKTLSPATVSSVFQQYRDEPKKAIAELRRMVKLPQYFGGGASEPQRATTMDPPI